MKRTLFCAFFLLASIATCFGGVRITDKPGIIKKIRVCPGDTIKVANGVYENVSVRFIGCGSEDAPAVLMAETPGGVVFSTGCNLNFYGKYLVLEGFRFENQSPKGYSYVSMADTSAYCRISECVFDGSGCDCKAEGKWGNFVQLRGSYQEVSHCAFLDKRTIGAMLAVNISAGQAVRHVIRDNYFSHPFSLRSSSGRQLNGQESMRVGSSTWSMTDAGCVVTGNWFRHCDGEIEIISSKCCGNLYEDNLFEECSGTLTLRHGNDCTVRGNFFIGNGKKGSGGVRIIGERHLVEGNFFKDLRGSGPHSPISVIRGYENPGLAEYWQVKDAVVKGNWLVDCDYGMQLAIPLKPANKMMPEGLRIEGNTIVCRGKGQRAVDLYDMPASDVVWKGNVIRGGSQSGVSLKEARKEPCIPDFTGKMQRIRLNAGPSFDKPQIDN